MSQERNQSDQRCGYMACLADLRDNTHTHTHTHTHTLLWRYRAHLSKIGKRVKIAKTIRNKPDDRRTNVVMVQPLIY